MSSWFTTQPALGHPRSHSKRVVGRSGRRRPRSRLAAALVLFALAPSPAAELAVAPVLAPAVTLAERFGTHLARGFQRRRLWADVLAPADLPDAVTTDELLGPLTADSAASLAERLGTPFLARCGIGFDSRLAVAQLYDLRGPWLLGQASQLAAGPAELLALADQLAGRLEPCWPIEAHATRDGEQVTIDRGHLHGLRRGDRLWLVASPERDAVGQYARPVAIARITWLHPRDTTAAIELAGPALDEAEDLLAVRPAQLAADPLQWSPSGIWLEHDPAGGWQPSMWLDWRRLLAPEVVDGRWRLPGQIVPQASPAPEPQSLSAAELPRLTPPGPYRIGQPWTATVPTLPGTVEVSLWPPDRGSPRLLVWRSAEWVQPLVVDGLAGPTTGLWTLRVSRRDGDRVWTGDVALEVVP